MHATLHQQRLPKYKRAPETFGRIELTARDVEILRLVHEYRYLTAELILALVPGSRRQIARRLQGLFHHAFLARLLPPLRIQHGDEALKGSPRIAYALDKEGAKAVSEHDHLDPDSIRWAPDALKRMHWFLEHALMVSEFRATLELALDGDPRGLQHLEWIGEEDLRDVVSVRYPNGSVQQHRVAPDGYFAVREGGERRNFFLEADRGTEDHPRLLHKFQSYWWYLSENSPYSKRYENAKNRVVLIVTTSRARLEGMRRTLRRVDAKGRGLRQFWFTTQDAYTVTVPSSILGPIWHVGPHSEDDHARSLFEHEEAPR